MKTKKAKNSRLTQALLETAKDMNNVGVLGEAAYKKITMRHSSIEAKFEPLTGNKIRMIRKHAHMSQAVFAQCLNVSPGYVSKLERGEKEPSGTALVLLNVIHRKGIEAIL